MRSAGRCCPARSAIRRSRCATRPCAPTPDAPGAGLRPGDLRDRRSQRARVAGRDRCARQRLPCWPESRRAARRAHQRTAEGAAPIPIPDPRSPSASSVPVASSGARVRRRWRAWRVNRRPSSCRRLPGHPVWQVRMYAARAAAALRGRRTARTPRRRCGRQRAACGARGTSPAQETRRGCDLYRRARPARLSARHVRRAVARRVATCARRLSRPC